MDVQPIWGPTTQQFRCQVDFGLLFAPQPRGPVPAWAPWREIWENIWSHSDLKYSMERLEVYSFLHFSSDIDEVVLFDWLEREYWHQATYSGTGSTSEAVRWPGAALGPQPLRWLGQRGGCHWRPAIEVDICWPKKPPNKKINCQMKVFHVMKQEWNSWGRLPGWALLAQKVMKAGEQARPISIWSTAICICIVLHLS